MLSTIVTLVLLPASTPGVTQLPSAPAILATVASKKAERMRGVENYTIIQRAQGAMEAPFYHEAMGPGGGLYRVVPIAEWQERNAPPGFDAAAMAGGLKLGMNLLAGGLSAQIAGTPAAGILGPGAFDGMMAGVNEFLDAATNPNPLPNTSEDDAISAANAARAMARARVVGIETVNGQRAFLLRADNLSDIPVQQMGDATFVLERASMWIDAEKYVELRLRMEGRMEAGGRAVPIVIESEELDYASVGSLYQPLSKVMRISGLMSGMSLDPKEALKMEKMRRDMERMRVQLERMPPAQRAMVAGQVAKAEAMMAQMTGNDVMETTVEFMVYSINKGPPFKWMPFCPSLEPDAQPFPPGAAGAAAMPPGACGL